MAIRSLKNGTFSRSLLIGNAAYSPTNFESIATATGNGSAWEITFSSIPSTYTHLQIRCIANASNVNTALNMRINGDTGSNYIRHRLIGNGSTVSAAGSTSLTQIPALGNAGLPTTSLTYGVFVWDILDYKDTNKYKTIRYLSGQDTNSSGGVDFGSGLWVNTNAITSITLKSNDSGGVFNTASQFALYGIRSA
jgi:hypothetical protein